MSLGEEEDRFMRYFSFSHDCYRLHTWLVEY